MTGVELERNKLYEIKGRIEGAFEFDIYRTASKYVYLMPSLEQRDRLRPGRVYDVKIESIKEVPLTNAQREILGGPQKRGAWRSTMYKLNHMKVETNEQSGPIIKEKIQTKQDASNLPKKMVVDAAFSLRPWLHKWGKPRYEFTVPNKDFEKAIGIRIEEMRDYAIKVTIEGLGQFEKKLHRCAVGQDIPVYVPSRLTDRVIPDLEYDVRIAEITKLPPHRTFTELVAGREIPQWTWRDVAAWVDGEGSIQSNLRRGGSYSVYVTQKERAMLETLGAFLEKEGFNPKLRLERADGVYRLTVEGAVQAARVVKEIEPFIRTVHRREQIAEFKLALLRERKVLRPEIRTARKILGLGDD